MTSLRWWIALNLVASGLTWIVVSIIFPIDVRPLWFLRRVIAVALGAGMLSCAYLLAIRIRPKGRTLLHPDKFKSTLIVSSIDGFLVFSVASFLLIQSLLSLVPAVRLRSDI